LTVTHEQARQTPQTKSQQQAYGFMLFQLQCMISHAVEGRHDLRSLTLRRFADCESIGLDWVYRLRLLRQLEQLFVMALVFTSGKFADEFARNRQVADAGSRAIRLATASCGRARWIQLG
jgi:hypothetical protein